MSDAIPCPTCGVLMFPPRFRSVETTTWSDDCACSDKVTCVAHQISGLPPRRPSVEVLEARAEARHAEEVTRFLSRKARFATCSPDNPEMDATDGAHPAWWRGHDYVSMRFYEELAKARERADKAEAKLAELEARMKNE